MNTAKVAIGWDCNLNCEYCCNKLPHVRDSFKPITLEELTKTSYKDYEITGGEPLLKSNFHKTQTAMLVLPPKANKYLYTNGLFLDRNTAQALYHFGITGINIGYHRQKLNWNLLREIHKYIIPIRLWVKVDEIKEIPSVGLPVYLWRLGDCDEITTDRFYLI